MHVHKELFLLKNCNFTDIYYLKNLKSNSDIIEYYQKLKESLENLKKLLKSLYSNFKNAPKQTGSGCDNVEGCISGYRSYDDQVKNFGNKIKNRGLSVEKLQKVVALRLGTSVRRDSRRDRRSERGNAAYNRSPRTPLSPCRARRGRTAAPSPGCLALSAPRGFPC